MARHLFHGSLLRLAERQAGDLEIMARWSLDPEYARNMDTDAPRPLSPEEVFDPPSSPTSFAFRLRTIDKDVLIGFVVLFRIDWQHGNGMLAIGIGERSYRGRGYGSDALQLILNYAFHELNLYRIALDVNGNNTAAIQSYERNGFVREGVWRQALLRDGVRHDRVLMSILRPEWEALAKG